jgi:hypothetical protein
MIKRICLCYEGHDEFNGRNLDYKWFDIIGPEYDITDVILERGENIIDYLIDTDDYAWFLDGTRTSGWNTDNTGRASKRVLLEVKCKI